jgi:hypothetical protein
MTNIATSTPKWSRLLSSISAYKLFNASFKNSVMEELLGPVCTLAFALGKLYEKPITDGFHIAIAGADTTECLNGGDTYRLLSTLLGVENLRIDLVGPEVSSGIITVPQLRLKPSIGRDVRVSRFTTTIGDYIKTVTPDVIMLNHPGFESYYDAWFTETELLSVFDRGIKILGTSYADDEAEIDAYYLKAYGFTASSPIKNPFTVDRAQSFQQLLGAGAGYDLAKAGLLNWAGEVWCIEGKKTKDEELIELLGSHRRQCHDLAMSLPEPSSLPLHIDATDQNGDLWVLIKMDPEPIFYSREKAVIVSGDTGVVIAEDVELDVGYIKTRGKRSFFQSSLISAVISRDYAEEINAFIQEYYEDDFTPFDSPTLAMFESLLR